MKGEPESLDFEKDIIGVLQDVGGKAKAAEVIVRVMAKHEIAEADYPKFEKGTLSGVEAVRNQIRWARQYLINKGYLKGDSAYGTWELSDKGAEFDRAHGDIAGQSPRLFSGQSASGGAETAEKQNTAAPIPGEEYRGRLLHHLRNLSPGGFERICARLVREMGFEDVEGTPLTRDGGIDGFGVLVLNPLVRQRFVYQCKKYTDNAVGSPAVQQFESAARSKGARMGAIITTSTFTADARTAAAEFDISIELIDGEALVGLFVKYELGVKTKRVIEVDEHFFAQYKDKT